MAGDFKHRSVLKNSVIQSLNIHAQGCYVDATFGRGGHSEAIAAQLNQQGKLVAIDKDPEAALAAQTFVAGQPKFIFVHDSFSELGKIMTDLDLMGKVDGLIFDLGVSSPQLDDAERGFSFMRDGTLDMRMNPEQGQSAAEWIAIASEAEIARVLWVYGEEKFSRRIARAIVAQRDIKQISTTGQLADIICKACPKREIKKHPATRSFMAIRIFINKELEEIEQALDDVIDILRIGGRLVVLSFHSLEDRIVKRFMQKQTQGKQWPRELPVMADDIQPRLKWIKKMARASANEVTENVRARSAIMRVVERAA